ncbi:NAD(P)/FAD-dependent oxidoreductase [Jeotgalibacillus marinus]|uniref:NAD(P)/FAD-dependent oxidoreductase n=1 Tax=Jeotgalibacillus marinus TaxID=86667 RepID=A0ABV3Q2Q0_9BACL
MITETGTVFYSRKIILASGIKETLPDVNEISEYYGKSLFSCPYCDGWELRDRPLVLISEDEYGFDMAKIISNWSKDLLICTNGHHSLTDEEKSELARKGIQVIEKVIDRLVGRKGYLNKIVFEDGSHVKSLGGFIAPEWEHATSFGDLFGCEINDMGSYVVDEFGRTSVDQIYAAGDTSIVAPSQQIIAAAEGSRAAIGVNIDLTYEDF